MKHAFCIIYLFTILIGTSIAQDILVLMPKNKKKQILIKSGQMLRFRLKGEEHFNQEKITSLENGLIFLQTSIIKFEDIDAIDIRSYKTSKFNVNSYASSLPVAGVAYLLVDQFNQVIVDGNKFNISNKSLKLAGILIASGIIISKLKKKYFHLNSKNKLRIIKSGN